jgi:hypothetical protein
MCRAKIKLYEILTFGLFAYFQPAVSPYNKVIKLTAKFGFAIPLLAGLADCSQFLPQHQNNCM